MKKLSALLVAGAFAFQMGTAVAAEMPRGFEPVVKNLFHFNLWLNRNNFEGSVYLNGNANEAFKLARAWDDRAELYSATILNPENSCTYVFGSVNKPKEMYSVTCNKDLGKQVATVTDGVGKGNLKDALFMSPDKNLRQFMSQVLKKDNLVLDIRDYFNGTSVAGFAINLYRDNGNIMWKLEIVDTNKQKQFTVTGSAMNDKSDLNVQKL